MHGYARRGRNPLSSVFQFSTSVVGTTHFLGNANHGSIHALQLTGEDRTQTYRTWWERQWSLSSNLGVELAAAAPVYWRRILQKSAV
jgi:hypothetical protein